MTRSLGDDLLHVQLNNNENNIYNESIVSNIPEYSHYIFDKNNAICIIIASDGIWDRMTNERNY